MAVVGPGPADVWDRYALLVMQIRMRARVRSGVVARAPLSGACRYAQASLRRCCAAFALGNTSSKACPAGYVRLNTNADACKGAAAVAGRTFFGGVTVSYYPFGCYWHTFNDKVYFNNYAGTIEAETYAQPLCTGAPTMPTHARTQGCTGTRAYRQSARRAPARAQAGKHAHRQKRADADARCFTQTQKQKPARAHTGSPARIAPC
jgi:hypothetical protein